MKKYIATLIAISVVFSCVQTPIALAIEDSTEDKVVQSTETPKADFSKFTDVPESYWAKDTLRWATDLGIIAGTTETTLLPDGNISRAQMATMIVRAFGSTKQGNIESLVDVPKDMWCHDAIAIAAQMGFLTVNGNTVSPNEQVSREEIAVSLVKAAGYTLVDGSLSKYSDASNLSDTKRKYIATAIANGLITGYEDGTLRLSEKVTRAQFVTMMYRMASAYMTKNSTFSGKELSGSLVVGVGNISLTDMTIDGNVFITDGVGSDSVVLDGTQVTGTIYVRGTGTSGLKLKNNSKATRVVVCNGNSPTSIEVEVGSYINSTVLTNTNSSVTLSGDVGNISVQTGNAPISLIDATAGNVSIESKLTQFKVDSNSTTNNIAVTEDATGCTLELSGTSKDVSVDASNTSISVNGRLSSLDVGSNISNLSITFSTDCRVDDVTLSTKELKATLNGKLEDVRLSGNKQDISIGSNCISDSITVSGDDSTFSFSSGSSVKKIYSSSDSLEFSGNGGVDKFEITDGDDILIKVPDAEVYNKAGTKVYVGEVRVNKGETVTVNASGNGTVEHDKEVAKEKENSSSSSNSSNSSSGSSSSSSGSSNSSNSSNSSTPSQLFTPEFSVKLASDGYPSDFGFSNSYSYSDFGLGLTLNSANELGGTVYYIEDFKWFSTVYNRQDKQTGYYVPLVIVSDYSSEKATLQIGDASFDIEARSNGTAYAGKMIAYVPLNPDATDKTIKITYDIDGDGTNYGGYTVAVDYSKVVFEGGPAEATQFDNIKAMPGLDGAETPTVTQRHTDSDTVLDRYYALSTSSLLEARNSEGRYGHWVGLRIPIYSDVEKITCTLYDPENKTEESTPAIYTAEDGSHYIDLIVDASKKTLNEGIYKVILSFYKSDDTPTRHASLTLHVDVSSCIFAGESSVSTASPVASGLTLAEVSTQQVNDISTRVPGYRVSDNAIGGVSTYTDSLGGYYIPVVLKGDVFENCSLYVDDKPLTTLTTGSNTSAVVNIPLTLLGSKVKDVKLVVKPTSEDSKYKETYFLVDTSALSVASSTFVASTEVPENVDGFILSPTYEAFASTITVKGNVVKQASPPASYLSGTTTVWAVPIKLYVNSDNSNWEIKINQGNIGGAISPVTFSASSGIIYVPMAINAEKFNATSIDLYDTATNTLVSSVTVYNQSTLVDFYS